MTVRFTLRERAEMSIMRFRRLKNSPSSAERYAILGRLMVTTPTDPVDSPLPKKPPDFFPQLAQVKAQTAAHRTDIRGLHVAVDVV